MFIVFFIALGIVVNSVQCQCGADGGINYDSVAGNLRPCCADHDNCYSKCGKTQLACDETFHRCMKNKCGNNWGCLRKADVFYQGVASGGREAYNNAQRASGCKTTPTGTGCPSNEGLCDYHCKNKVVNAAGTRPSCGKCQSLFEWRCTCIFGRHNC